MTIHHDTEERRFWGSIEGKEFFLEYERDQAGNILVTHTSVHPDLRGQGIASHLLTHFSAWAEENAHRVIPICSYAVVFYHRHPEYAHLLQDGPHDEGRCVIPRKKPSTATSQE